MNCSRFKRDLYHYQAEQLPADERAAYLEHAGACPPCARLLEIEAGLLRGLKTRLAPASPPPGLETRIREQLRTTARSKRPGVAWIRQPWFAAVAASLLLALLVVPDSLGPSASSSVVTAVVTVVDYECDRAGLPFESQRACTHPKHLNALKLDEGGYWQISSDQPAGRDLITDRALRGARMRVQGLFFERIRTLRLERADEAGGEAARLGFSFH